jgi:hypothetical protein
MFTDPLNLVRLHSTITADGASTISMAASERAADHSTYRYVDADGNDHVLFVGHNYGRRSRFTARYSISGFTPSALVPADNVGFSQSVYVVADVPSYGPIQSTSTLTSLFRRQMQGIGSLLVVQGAVSVDPLFARVVNGET